MITKLQIGVLSSLLFASFANADTLTHNVNVTGTVVSSCTASQKNYTADFGTFPGLTVGKANINLFLICSDGTPFAVVPNEDVVDNVDAWHDATYSNKFTSANPFEGVGTGSQQSIPVYFRYSEHRNGFTKIDEGQGNIIGDVGSINNRSYSFTIVY